MADDINKRINLTMSNELKKELEGIKYLLAAISSNLQNQTLKHAKSINKVLQETEKHVTKINASKEKANKLDENSATIAERNVELQRLQLNIQNKLIQDKYDSQAKGWKFDSSKLKSLLKNPAQFNYESLKDRYDKLSDDDKASDRGQSLMSQMGRVSKVAGTINTTQNIVSGIWNGFNKAISITGVNLQGLASSILDTTKEMLDFKSGIATYNTSNSLISNSSARNTMMQFGLNASQAYAFTTAKSMLGIESDDDLYYMNDAQRAKFNQYMDKYSKWYDEMGSSGVFESIQEMQLEFAELKRELSMEFLTWIADNKDTIITIIKGTFEMIKFIADKVMKILEFLAPDVFTEEEIMSNINTKNTSITINSNTTINGTDASTAQLVADSTLETVKAGVVAVAS